MASSSSKSIREKMSDVLPSCDPQKSQNDAAYTQPQKIVTPTNQPPVELKKSKNPWTRPHKRERGLSEEKKKTAELYRIVLSILNKLTPEKFKTLVKQIRQLDIDTPERLEGVVDQIFEKIIREPMYSVVYSNMCRCLLSIKVSGPDEKDVSFRKLLLRRCQKEFEKGKKDETELLEEYIQLERLSDEEKKIKKEELDEKAAKNKRRTLGNIKFIGELFKLKLLTENIMHDCIFKLLRAGDEESLESMCLLLVTIGKDLDSEEAKPRMDQYFEEIDKIINCKKVSYKVWFKLRDVVDLRASNWIPRREEKFNPKTIDQIHEEVRMERTKKRRSANSNWRARTQNTGGGRDSPKMMPRSGDGWIATGRSGKPVPIDHNKLKSMDKRAVNTDDKISLGPSNRFGQWGRGSSGSSSNASGQSQEQESRGNRFSALSEPSNRPYDPRRTAGSRPSSGGSKFADKRKVKGDRYSALEAVRSIVKPQTNTRADVSQVSSNAQEVSVEKFTKTPSPEPQESHETEPLSEEEMMKKTRVIIDELVNIEDIQEAVSCFTDLHCPKLHDLFVTTAVEHTYDTHSKARRLTGMVLSALLATGKLTKGDFFKGLNDTLANAEDKAIDYPKLWCYLAEIITPVVVEGTFCLSDLKPLLLMHLMECRKAGVLLAEILTVVKSSMGEKKTLLLWTNSNISWSEVLPSDVPCNEFLGDRKLTFLLREVDPLRSLLSEDNVSHDRVFSYIEKNYEKEKRKEAGFISQLATVVAESCIVNKVNDEPECCVERLKARKNILLKYLDNNRDLEVEVLFGLQKLYVGYNKSSGLLLPFFNTLYDEEVITEDSFYAWKDNNDPSRQEAKGRALQATAVFFDWLQSATVETNDT